MKKTLIFLAAFLIFNVCSCTAKSTADTLDENMISQIMNGCFQVHVSQKSLTPQIVELTLSNFVDSLDYSRLFFLESDVNAIMAEKIKFPKYFAAQTNALIPFPVKRIV